MIGKLAFSGARQAACSRAQRSTAGAKGAAARIARVCRAAPAVDSPTNGTTSSSNGKRSNICPTPAETARTIVDIVNEGSLCSLCADGSPLGAPVAYQLDKDGQPIIEVAAASPEAANLQRDARVSLLVQATSFPARGVASVALQGSVVPHETEEGSSSSGAAYKLNVDKAVYYGGLDHVSLALFCVCCVLCSQPILTSFVLRATQT